MKLRDPSVGYVYFIRATGPIDRIKIGTSTSPRRRFEDLQISSPVDLECLKVICGGVRVERLWHQKWHYLHCRGEWFSSNIHLLSAIKQAECALSFSDMQHPSMFSPQWEAREAAIDARAENAWNEAA